MLPDARPSPACIANRTSMACRLTRNLASAVFSIAGHNFMEYNLAALATQHAGEIRTPIRRSHSDGRVMRSRVLGRRRLGHRGEKNHGKSNFTGVCFEFF